MSQKPARRNVRGNARSAISKVLGPLLKFALETGLSVKELEGLLRDAAVRSVGDKQVAKRGRVNISGISAKTGLSRTEVARILNRAKVAPVPKDQSSQLTNRVLAAWHDDPKYTDQSGKPLVLEIFGKGLTFESLVRSYGRGIPIRAILDELVDVDAVDVIGAKMVRAKSNVAVYRGLQPRMIESYGDRAAELLEAMLGNIGGEERPNFVATVESRNVPIDLVPLIRREVVNRGSIFMSSLEGSLFPETNFESRSSIEKQGNGNRVSVTIFYFDNARKEEERIPGKTLARRNLSRKGRQNPH